MLRWRLQSASSLRRWSMFICRQILWSQSLHNFNSTYYIRDGADNIQILSMDAFSDCYSFLNVIICNSLIKESFFKPENCLEQLINEKSVNFCKYKRIKNIISSHWKTDGY